ncbi:MAG: hypothetical protein ABGX20_15805 [Bacillus sp. (in: firmicutes)]
METRKAKAPWSAPTGKCSSAKKVRLLTFIAEGYLTRGARRWSWTILEVEFYMLILKKNRGINPSVSLLASFVAACTVTSLSATNYTMLNLLPLQH